MAKGHLADPGVFSLENMTYDLKVTLCYIDRLTWVNGIFYLFQFQRTKLLNGPDVETGTSTAIPQKKWLHFISPIFVQALTLTFLAEWGDRSQLTTIVLAAREVSVCDLLHQDHSVGLLASRGQSGATGDYPHCKFDSSVHFMT